MAIFGAKIQLYYSSYCIQKVPKIAVFAGFFFRFFETKNPKWHSSWYPIGWMTFFLTFFRKNVKYQGKQFSCLFWRVANRTYLLQAMQTLTSLMQVLIIFEHFWLFLIISDKMWFWRHKYGVNMRDFRYLQSQSCQILNNMS